MKNLLVAFSLLAVFFSASAEVLGPSKAYDIITKCAGSTDLNGSASDAGNVNSIYGSCVSQGLKSVRINSCGKGTSVGRGSTLFEDITAIQGCEVTSQLGACYSGERNLCTITTAALCAIPGRQGLFFAGKACAAN